MCGLPFDPVLNGWSVKVPINVVYSITRKLFDSCRKTKHGEDKLDSLSQNIQKNAIKTRTTTNHFTLLTISVV